ncbi:hypothetical protein GF378_01510, partial [Candidatus Pacearchaeota archaeon]|nr:hypothetical protein [Candidatus Pacearchaeota archaeon]
QYSDSFLISDNVTITEPNCSCVNCSDCETKLNNPSCSYVDLTQGAEVSGTGGTFYCINDPINFTNKIFDCNNHLINNTGTTQNRGIYLDGNDNNTIKNCVVANFEYGIRLDNLQNNSLYNNSLYDNSYGLYFLSSENNNLTQNHANDNTNGVFLSSSNYNIIHTNNASSNTNGIYLSDSNNNNITNNLANSNSYNNFYFVSSDYNNVVNNTANSQKNTNAYYAGFKIYDDCDYNEFINNTANNNNNFGFYILGGTGTTFSNGNQYNNFTGNDAHNNNIGFNLMRSTSTNHHDEGYNQYNTFKENNATNNSLESFSLPYDSQSLYGVSDCSNEFDTTNIAGEGKPLLYLNNENGLFMSHLDNYSQIILCNVSNSIFDNITVENDGIGYSDYLVLYESVNTTIKNSNFYNTYRGIHISGIKYSNISNNNISETWDVGIKAYGGGSGDENNTIEYNFVENTGASLDSNGALYLQRFSNNNITENKILNSYDGDGIYVYSSDYLLFDGNNVSRNGRGIYTDLYSSHHTFTNNIFEFNDEEGVYFSDNLANFTNNTASHNGVDTTSTGFYLRYQIPIFTNNTAINNSGSGVHINYDTSQLGEVSGNELHNNVLNGLEIYDGQNLVIDSNNATGNGLGQSLGSRNGIYLYGFERANDYFQVTNNNLEDNSNGIFLADITQSNITNNILINNSYVASSSGFFIDFDVDYNVFSNNTLENNTIGLQSDSSGSNDYNNFTFNTFYNNDYGVILESFAGGHHLFEENHIFDNINTGLQIDTDNNHFIGNIIENNSIGVSFESGADNNLVYDNFFNNTLDANDSGVIGDNFWNTTYNCDEKSYVEGCLGGNLWGSYYNQRNATDRTGDGIGDDFTPWSSTYSSKISGSVEDYLPLAVIRCGDELIGDTEISSLNDLSGCNPNGLNIIDNNVDLDCNNYIINGTGSYMGINATNVDNVSIERCPVYNFSTGIYLENADNSFLSHNLLIDNSLGINITSTSTGGVIYYNYFNNTNGNNAYDIGDNDWNDSILGNFWSDYTEDNYNNTPKDDYNVSVYGGTPIPGQNPPKSYSLDYEPHPSSHYYETIFDCGTVIDADFNDKEVTILGDMHCDDEDGIIIDFISKGSVDNVTINCDGRSITGDGTHSGIKAIGSGSSDRDFKGSTIKNCIISNFSKGIEFRAHAYAYSESLAIGCAARKRREQQPNNNYIEDNEISNCDHGIWFSSDEDTDHGGGLYNCDAACTDANVYSNTLNGNELTNNNIAIHFTNTPDDNSGDCSSDEENAHVENNIIHTNTITNNSLGINFTRGKAEGQYPQNNYIYDNLFNNTHNVYAVTGSQMNYWNVSNQTGTSIVGGTHLGGNYWHDYTGVDDGSNGRIAGDYLGDTQ